MLKSTKASNEMDGVADVSNQQNSEPQPNPNPKLKYLIWLSTLEATGGGAFKFADLEKLGISLDKEDEMDCFVAGANFFLKAVHQEACTYLDGQKEFVQIDHNNLYPYLLVNIGSGVGLIKVDGDGKFERVNGTNLGGILGFGKAFDKGKNFDELLELSHLGNNKVLDMLVGDIYGGTGYSKIGLSATTIASRFGKAISDNKKLEDCKPEDIARSLLRMISNNIDQGHAYTRTLSVAVHFWSKSKGRAKAMFLQHEGFLGALGAFMSYEKQSLDGLMVHKMLPSSPISLSSAGDKIHCSQNSDSNDD